jgi:hypothetical protein
MATKIRTLDFLPEIFQTPTNQQFLSATLDQLVNPPDLQKIQGYVGSRYGYGVNPNDYYVTEPDVTRTNYQLDPGVVFTQPGTSTATDFISYPGLIDALNTAGGVTNNNNRLFNSQFYSWDSFVNLDPLVNFNQYYWLPEGPPSVTVAASTVYSTETYVVNDQPTGYFISTLNSAGGSINPTLTLLRSGVYEFVVNQPTDFWIQTQPGISGRNPSNPNQTTREIFGVTNNGANSGVITFAVPQSNAQQDLNIPGNNLVSVVSNISYQNLNGAPLSSIGSIDGVTSLNGLTVMFYDTGVPNEIAYTDNTWGNTEYAQNDPNITAPQNITITATSSTGNVITCSSVEGMQVNQSIAFTGVSFGGITVSPIDSNGNITDVQIYYVKSINATDNTFTISSALGGPAVSLTTATGTMNAIINDMEWEQGCYSSVNNNFYKITLAGDPSNPVILLSLAGQIPVNQKITAVYGNTYGGLSFYLDTYNNIEIIPLITAPLNTLYYQDGRDPNKVGTIQLIDNNIFNQLDVTTQIIGQKNFTSSNGVVFTNGLKVTFDGDVIPSSYLSGEYYVSGVGVAIELLPVDTFVVPEPFTGSVYNTYSTEPYDTTNYDDSLYIPVTPDYITIARDSLSLNAWSRSNRWFHIQVIQDTATYNNDPSILTTYGSQQNKAVRPILEFYPNLRLFNSGTAGKLPVDFIDFRTTDALNDVAGQPVYYPDVEVYTSYTANIAAATNAVSTTITVAASAVNGTFAVGMYINDSQNVLPPTAQITEISGTTTLTITVGWDDALTIPTTNNVSLVADQESNQNYILFSGARIIFAADPNENNKIFIVNITTVDTGSKPVIVLSETPDGNIVDNNLVAVLRGYNYQGYSFYYNIDAWVEAQQKTTVNQAPFFDVFDSNGISFSDPTVYLGTNFAGSTLFAYGVGTGTTDTVLGFPLRYSSVNNIGDISFDVTYNSQTFDYITSQTPITQNISTGYVYNMTGIETFERLIGWQTAVGPSVQYQVFSFNYYEGNTNANVFECDIVPVSTDSTPWPVIEVFVDGEIQPNSNYTVSIIRSSTIVTVTIPNTIVNGTVQIFLLSDQVSANAYYEIPTNLSNNPFNTDITVANTGDIRRQYESIFYNNPNFTGTVLGSNNYRDLGNLVPWGNVLIENSASLVLPGTFLRNLNYNIFDSIAYNSKKYIEYKNLIVSTVNSYPFSQTYDPAYILNTALDVITATKDNSMSFFWSDMLPAKAPYASNVYTFNNSLQTTIYPLTQTYNFETANYNGVLVYLARTVNGLTTTQQLIKGVDYTVSTTAPSLEITIELLPGDVVTINEYNQTYGSYVPNTPTKLGLYPAYVPGVVLDSDYAQPTYFIRGHDGSYNKLYGDYIAETNILIDFRDQALLEFETRIYNNLKLSNTLPILEQDIVPGFFRNSDYSYEEWLEAYEPGFLNWVGQNRLNYQTQYYDPNNQYTWNYNTTTNKVDNTQIGIGYWRGVYKYFYDTFTPNTTPWELLGFTSEPSWWTSRYGAAPYTSNNLVLWGDLEAGINYNNGDPVIIPQAVRPGLSKIIPVDSQGNLVSPFVSVVKNYYNPNFKQNWEVGDIAPVELSYRRSSSWPFDFMRIQALLKPAEFFNLGVYVDNYQYNAEFNQYLFNGNNHLLLNEIPVYGNGTAVTSYINWIVDYQKQYGIDATTAITTLLNNLDVRLVYRLAGFSDQNLLNFYVQSTNPNSNNSTLLIPNESYQVLLYSNPPYSGLKYSSVIVQILQNGFYAITGNSQTSAYFTVLTPKNDGQTTTITVDNLTVKVAKNYTDVEQVIPYGTQFISIQQVAEFLASYGAYLEANGVQYQYQVNSILLNWTQMISEFLYWTLIGWQPGALTTLNPAAYELTIDLPNQIVQPLSVQGANFVLNQNLYPIKNSDLNILRDGTLFNVAPLRTGDTISYGQFNLSNFENACVFDNYTLFGDTIYDLTTGTRQNRIYVRGSKTASWDGTYTASGFIINNNNVVQWQPSQRYTKGQIVLYKNQYWIATDIIQPSATFQQQYWKISNYNQIQTGLLPNSSTQSAESQYFYDTNVATINNDANLLGYSLIGYRQRDYAALVDLTDTTQVNVYQNLIKTKGSLNAVNAFVGADLPAKLPAGGINYNLYENWAIQTSSYGGTTNNNFVQFRLNAGELLGNPSVVGLTDGVYTTGVEQEVPLTSLYNYSGLITDPNILSTIPYVPSTLFSEAGYVNFNDVKMSSYFYSNLATAVSQQGTIVPITNFYVGDYVWVANYLNKWQVYTPTSIGQVVLVQNNLNNTCTVTFSAPHNLSQYDLIAIVNFNSQVDGYYSVSNIVDNFRITIFLNISNSTRQIVGQGVAMYLTSQRVASPADVINLPLIDFEFEPNTVWVDTNTDGSWAVYQKTLNYTYEQEFNYEESTAFGTAVCYNQDLGGYLLSDPGTVYRYDYDPLNGQYNIFQQLTGNASTYGSTITNEQQIYVVSQTTSDPAVYLYTLNTNNILSDNLIPYQTNTNADNTRNYSSYQGKITAPTGVTNFGYSTALSGDTNWLYVSDIVDNKVYVYKKQNILLQAGYFVTGETYTITSVGTTDFTTCTDQSDYPIQNKVGTVFVASNAGTGTGTASQCTYVLSTVIDGSGFSSSGDNFGNSIATDYYGDTVIIGAPGVDYSSSVQNYGSAYVYDRSKQNFVTGIINSALVPTFNLAWTPTTLTKTPTSVTTGNQIVLSNTTGITNGMPIIFTGTSFGATGLQQNVVYYVLSVVDGTHITLKASRNTTTPVTLSSGVLTGGVATAQNHGITVSVNGNTVQDNNYAVVGTQLIYTGTLTTGDIVTVDDNVFTLVQTLTTENTPEIGVQFGTSIDTTQFATEVIIGAPFELTTQLNEGAVYRFTNAGGKYGTIYGTSAVNVTSLRPLLINGFAVYVIGNASSVATSINQANILNVQASATSDNKLIISLINPNLSQANEELIISTLDPLAFGELGIQPYTLTQTILCPHDEGATQFGTTVKFNEQGSFVASAPVGTRFESTTFDQIEYPDNDTIFDNNTTQFIEQYANAGAVYMFDYLGVYNENINNTGNFVYAQSVNAQDTNYGLQPRYGTALDFVDNRVVIGTPNFKGVPNTIESDFVYGNGQVITYVNNVGTSDWSVYRQSSPIVDINKIGYAQIFSATSNQTLVNLDYFDPQQNKLLGAVAENIDYIANTDPASYNTGSVTQRGIVWGKEHVGNIWFNTQNVRFVNYHQNDVTYNSAYWGILFPGSDVAVYTWVESNVPPVNYAGPGEPYNTNSYSVETILNSSQAAVLVYYFWVRNTGVIFTQQGKNLSDTVLAGYIASPQNSGISYVSPVLPNVFSLYNSSAYLNGTDSIFNIAYATGTTNDAYHQEYALIRENYPEDFLPGLPNFDNKNPSLLYQRFLYSLSGVDAIGQVVPNPFLPIHVQTGVSARPRQSFFLDRFLALQNYIQFANNVLIQYPISETRENATFLFTSGEFYNTSDFWSYVNWWASGYDDSVRSSVVVPIYADLETLTVAPGTIVKVQQNGKGFSEWYIYNTDGTWTRIGLQNGTIQISSNLYNYPAAGYGFAGNFFGTTPFDQYPSEETYWIARALNEQIFTSELLIYRNQSLILMFQYISTEAVSSQNYLTWLNKTSLVDVSHNIRNLVPLENYQSDNQDFLSGYLSEALPYHVYIKNFTYVYTGSETYAGNITDFDLPSQYNSSIKQFISPELVYSQADNIVTFLPTASIWQEQQYNDWFNNYGVSLTGQNNVLITTVAQYVSIGSNSIYVTNSSGFPLNGIVTISGEQISYSSIDRNLGILYNLIRGYNGTPISTHLPGENIYIDLPPVLLLNGGRGYVNPPRVTAYIDTSIYPEPRVPAQLEAVMGLDTVVGINVINPGEGYAVLPEIIIDSSEVVVFAGTNINVGLNTITIYSSLLQTGDLVKYIESTTNTGPSGLVDNQWYYVGILQTTPVVVIALYANYSDSINDRNRVNITSQGNAVDNTLNLSARASAISTAVPVRENVINIKFDRTTYQSQVSDWASDTFYGSFFAGDLLNKEQVSSSNYTLENTQPNISTILASAQGAVFEITNVSNNQQVEWSTLSRSISNTFAATNSIRLSVADEQIISASNLVVGQQYTINFVGTTNFTAVGAAFNNVGTTFIATGSTTGTGTVIFNKNVAISGSTIGMTVGMPIQFTGVIGSSGLNIDTVYYVKSILNYTDFTISATIDQYGNPGSVYSLNDFTVPTSGLNCFVAQVINTAQLTVNYPGIRQVTTVTADKFSQRGYFTCPTSVLGTGGTQGFYIGLPVFFVGDVFGGVIPNITYYVLSILDNQNFTLAANTDVFTLTVNSTSSVTNYVNLNSTFGLNVNDPIVINDGYIAGIQTNDFGNILSDTIYFVSEIIDDNNITISTSYNGPVVSLETVGPTTLVAAGSMTAGQTYTIYFVGTSDFTLVGASSNAIGTIFVATGSTTGNGTVQSVYEATLTSQANTLQLSSATGSMTINLSLPVSPGQVNGQLFNLYKTSQITPNVSNGTITNQITGTIGALITTLNYAAITSSNGTNGYYVNMPITVGSGFTSLPAGLYYITSIGTISVIVTSTDSSTNRLTCSSNAALYLNMPIIFSNSSIGGIIIGQQYFVASIVGTTHFTISETQGGSTFVVTTDSGAMTGTGSPYITVSTTMSGSNVVLSNEPVSPPASVTLQQSPQNVAQFAIGYQVGGYSVIIENGGSGFAINNIITIPGTTVGGESPANDITLQVNGIDSDGAITSVIVTGTVPSSTENQYYLKVTGTNTFEVYTNPLMTIPVSGINFPYTGFTTSTVTHVNSSTSALTVADSSVFNLYDPVVFTGNIIPTTTDIVADTTYYVYEILSPTTFAVSAQPGVAPAIAMLTTVDVDFTVSKAGSYAFLPEPFYFNQSIVRFNEQVYVCIVSNNDTEFVYGKWQQLDSGDRRLNALDRIVGYYQPTVNMPSYSYYQNEAIQLGVPTIDFSQLVAGTEYPNSTYLGNQFQPGLQLPVAIELQDKPFYPTDINLAGIIYNGVTYVAPANISTGAALATNTTDDTWNITNLTTSNTGLTSINYTNNLYLLTCTNSATPILRSFDGVTWSSLGYYTSNYVTTLNLAGLSLNDSTYGNGIYVAVGSAILTSTDAINWTETLSFTGPLPTTLYSVTYVSIPTFTGFIAVGAGQRYDYSTGFTEIVDCNVVYTSTNGVQWSPVQYFSYNGLYYGTSNGTCIVAVGQNGIIYTSTNGTNWNGITETNVLSANGTNNVLNVGNTSGLTTNAPIRFSQSFNNIVAGTTYYVNTIVSNTQIKISATNGGGVLTLNSENPVGLCTLNIYPTYGNLTNVNYINSTLVALGSDGVLVTSTDNAATTWTTHTTGTTENLKGSVYHSGTYTIVGDNNTILQSTNLSTWTDGANFTTPDTIYNVQGSPFLDGYGPEELVAGVVRDNLTMLITTRPGVNWDVTEYAHNGYNVVSTVVSPTSETQTVYSFADFGVRVPTVLSVYVVNGTTNLCTGLYNGVDYTVNWLNKTITLNSALPYYPITYSLRIDLYEAGNGFQLVKSSTDYNPIINNFTTGFDEIELDCNFIASISAGNGAVQPATSPVETTATQTIASTNSIICDDVSQFVVNSSIYFEGTTFGNIQQGPAVSYYVKTISISTSSITVSASIVGGIAGPTFSLTNATGSMVVIISSGNETYWTPPLVTNKGVALTPGVLNYASATSSTNNHILCNSTSGIVVNSPIVFDNDIFGGINALQTYYVKAIIDNNNFTISSTVGGSTLTLTTAVGTSSFITYDYAIGAADNNITAKLIFSNPYDNADNFITYTILGETLPIQYGYTIPQTQLFTGNGATKTFTLSNYIGGDNASNAIVEVAGIRQTATAYSFDVATNQITFTSAPANGSTIAITTYNDTENQYLNTQYDITGNTVANIVSISNALSTPITTVATASSSSTNQITVTSTVGFIVGATVLFQGTSFDANITTGTIYFVKQVINGTHFTIANQTGTLITLAGGSGAMEVSVGGQPAVRVTTGIAHNLSDNNIIRIDGTNGSVQLNNNTYYVKVISSTVVDLYNTPYSAALSAVNNPVTAVSTYTGGGYVWLDGSYILSDTTASATATNGTITVTTNTGLSLIVGTPVYFTQKGVTLGTTFSCGIVAGQEYYVYDSNASSFRISATRYGSVLPLTAETGLTINVTQWQHINVDRLWVTVNGYRVPSSALRINPGNYVSILTTIQSSDTVIITSMMPSATPNEMVYIQNVNQDDVPTVYNSNSNTTWLTQPLGDLDTIIYVNDATQLTNKVVQNTTASTVDPVTGNIVVGLTVDKNTVTNIVVYNNTTGQTVPSSDYTFIVVDLSPTLSFASGVSIGNSLTITMLEGNLIYVNGEQIKFGLINLSNNSLTNIQRGANGTSQQTYIPVYTTVRGLLSINMLPEVYYNQTWNPIPGVYNTTLGDPLQIATTTPANILNMD